MGPKAKGKATSKGSKTTKPTKSTARGGAKGAGGGGGRKRKAEEDDESENENEVLPEKPPRPFKVQYGLPVSVDPPEYDILSHALSVSDSAVLYSSLMRSRKGYTDSNIFELYWAKGKTKFDNDVNARDRMNKFCDCKMEMGPHTFDVRFFILKDDEIERKREEEKEAKKLKRLANKKAREQQQKIRELKKQGLPIPDTLSVSTPADSPAVKPLEDSSSKPEDTKDEGKTEDVNGEENKTSGNDGEKKEGEDDDDDDDDENENENEEDENNEINKGEENHEQQSRDTTDADESKEPSKTDSTEQLPTLTETVTDNGPSKVPTPSLDTAASSGKDQPKQNIQKVQKPEEQLKPQVQQPLRQQNSTNDAMQTPESQMTIANLNIIARSDPALNPLMKIVASGNATPAQIREFQGYIQRAKSMGPPPHFKPIFSTFNNPPKPPKPPKKPKKVKPPREKLLTTFQEKYVEGAQLVFEFAENPNVRFTLPKDCIVEKSAPNEYLVSFLVVFNIEKIKKWELRQQNRKEKEERKAAENKELEVKKDANDEKSHRRTRGNDHLDESEKEAQPVPPKVEDINDPKPQPYFTAFSFKIIGVEEKYDPIFLNSFYKPEKVLEIMEEIISTGERAPKYMLWYQVDAYDDEDLAEELREQLELLENPPKKYNKRKTVSKTLALQLYMTVTNIYYRPRIIHFWLFRSVKRR